MCAFGQRAGRANHDPEAFNAEPSIYGRALVQGMRNSSLQRIENSAPAISPAPQPREYFVDAIEAGKFLSMHSRTLQHLARKNVVPAHPYGSGPRKTWRFLLSELDAWMRSQVNSACRPGPRKENFQ
jgi:hypothetical protein